MAGFKITKEEKKSVRVGIILISFATAMGIVLAKVNQIGFFVNMIGSALKPFLIGFALAYLLNVFVTFFEKVVFWPLNRKFAQGGHWRKAKRPLAILLSIALLIGFLAFLLLYILPEIVESSKLLMVSAQKSIPEYIADFQNWLQKLNTEYDLNLNFGKLFEQLNMDAMLTNMSNFTANLLTTVYNATKNVVSFVLTGIIAFIFSIYLIVGKEKLQRHIKRLLEAFVPDRISRKIWRVSAVTNEVFFSFIKGQLTECIILSVLCYVGMLIFRFDYALLISAVVGISALIPIMGAYIGALVGAFILVLTNPLQALLFLIFIIVLQQLEGNLIYPRVVGSSIGLPAIWTMFAVFFWGTMLGIPGVLLGTPMTAVCYRLVRQSAEKRVEKKKQVQKADAQTRKPADSQEKDGNHKTSEKQ